MKNYPMNIRNGVHTVAIKLQSQQYKGELQLKITGNTQGLTVLNYFDEDGDWLDENTTFLKNDCGLNLTQNYDNEYWFSCKLRDKEGNTIEIEMEIEYLKDYIVGIEIIDFEEEQN